MYKGVAGIKESINCNSNTLHNVIEKGVKPVQILPMTFLFGGMIEGKRLGFDS